MRQEVSSWTHMAKSRKAFATVKYGHIQVPVYRRQQEKKGTVYTSYLVKEKRPAGPKLWQYSDIEDAKAKAKDIAEAVGNGRLLFQHGGLRVEIRKALEAVNATGIDILQAATIFATALPDSGWS
jgi:hypothetical protein